MRRHNHKARMLEIDDPFSTQTIRYNTGAEYGATAISQYEGEKAAKASRNAQQAALNKQIALINQIRGENKNLMEPVMGMENDWYGLNGEEGRIRALKNFQSDPAYTMTKGAAEQAMNRSFSAKGGYNSGAAAAGAASLANNFADSYYNRLMKAGSSGARGSLVGQNNRYADTMMGLYGREGDITSNYANTMAKMTSDNAHRLAKYTDDTNQQVVDTAMSFYGMGAAR